MLCLLNLAACLSSKNKAGKSKTCKPTGPKALPGLHTGPRQLQGGPHPCQSPSSRSCTPAGRQSGHSTTCWTAGSPWRPRCCAGRPVSQTAGLLARSLSHHTLATTQPNCCLHTCCACQLVQGAECQGHPVCTGAEVASTSPPWTAA